MKGVLPALAASAVLVAAVPGRAQTVQSAGGAAQVEARQQVMAFEAALENAVRYGAQMLDQRLQASSAANMVMLAGMTRARGFRLDDYGVMFDVEFPSMRRSMVWSLQELERAAAGSTGRPVRAAETSSIQPREIYQSEIINALTNAILDYTAPVGVGAAEWLTIAARESVADRRFMAGNPNEMPMTMILRMKGSDLQELRDRKITRDEARKRVDVRQY